MQEVMAILLAASRDLSHVLGRGQAEA